MKPHFPSSAGGSGPVRASQQGAAIILVLLFVVMLAGLIVAFFSRAMTERQISNSSGNSSKVDIFAQGAADQIIADLQQEIYAGSTGTAAGSGTVYTPSAAGYAMPSLVGSSGTGGLENLVKVSLSGSAFYVGGNSRAINVSSVTPSLNGRYISVDRWNKALLMPVANSGTLAPVLSSGSFSAPNWVLVTRDGSNPTSWNLDMKSSGTGSSVVVGRYAYAIFHEGGLIDANVAGFPYYQNTPLLKGPMGTGAAVTYYKQAPAVLDLSQIKDGSGTSYLSMANAGKLAVWRNWATLGASGSFGGFSLGNATTSASDYYVYAISNTTGFLTVSGTVSNGQSDRVFTSRQQLIDFVKNSLGCTSTVSGANINILNYLTTFSRDLSQPSFAPDPNRPKVLASGTASASSDSVRAGGNSAYGGDDIINPSFLSVRVTGTFSRVDGSPAVVGEPLVKKRFSLNRLAWITYKGASADNMSDDEVKAAIRLLGGDSTDSANPIYQFVKDGTKQKIYDTFGLSWVSDPNNAGSNIWAYSHEGTSPLSSASSAPQAKIKTLADVCAAGREPDFFELLKAGLHVGSLGKSYSVYPSPSTGGSAPADYYGQRDVSTDLQVIQIGANIVDQFDNDGYPTRILSQTGLFGRLVETRGVEDLPYLYRVREAKVLVSDANVITDKGLTVHYNNLPVYSSATGTVSIQDPGKGISMFQPEIWNPHARSQDATTDNASTIRPTNFRVIAVTEDPNGNATSNLCVEPSWRSAVSGGGSGGDNGSGFYYCESATTSTPLTAANTELTFGIPLGSNYLFREPMLLITPGKPQGSSLSIGTGHLLNSVLGGSTPTSIGFVMSGTSALPLAWIENNLQAKAADGTNPTSGTSGVVPLEFVQSTFNTYITYRVQCKDPQGNWVTYDEKYTTPIFSSYYDTWRNSSGWGYTFTTAPAIGSEGSILCFDPRTPRFGMMYAGRGGLQGITLSDLPTSPVSSSENAMPTNRPDEYRGYLYSMYQVGTLNFHGTTTGPSAAGWYPIPLSSGNNGYTNAAIASGLYAQNNPRMNLTDNTKVTASVTLSDGALGGSGNGWSQVFSSGLRCFADPDGVVRRGMAAYTLPSSSVPAVITSGTPSSVPLKGAYSITSGAASPSTIKEAYSRPVVINRPFRSVAELGSAFSDTPWRNLDFSTPESGNAALLDLFCIADNTAPGDALVAGKVNLNTRQLPVIGAIVTNAFVNDFGYVTTGTTVLAGGASSTLGYKIAQALVSRTSSATGNQGPLTNLSDLVGRWPYGQAVGSAPTLSGGTGPFNIDGSQAYTGFSGTSSGASYSAGSPATDLSSVFTTDGSKVYNVQRYRESAIRALANIGQTRVWNLLVDVVAQTGRYPQNASNASQFLVEGEQRFWVHVAIDRETGKVIDKQVEVVKE
ncbi:MAG: hypothetical protein ACFUZC_16715 [Chthoniobacteraceae bacterium]